MTTGRFKVAASSGRHLGLSTTGVLLLRPHVGGRWGRQRGDSRSVRAGERFNNLLRKAEEPLQRNRGPLLSRAS